MSEICPHCGNDVSDAAYTAAAYATELPTQRIPFNCPACDVALALVIDDNIVMEIARA